MCKWSRDEKVTDKCFLKKLQLFKLYLRKFVPFHYSCMTMVTTLCTVLMNSSSKIHHYGVSMAESKKSYSLGF